MTKYSTGRGGGGDDGGACELCGAESSNLRRANVAGANLLVFGSCAPHGDNQHKRDKKRDQNRNRSDSEPNQKKRAAQKTAKVYDATRGDSTHWEKEGTNYERDRLPYLVSGYGERVETARQEAGLTIEELAERLDTDEDTVLAVEQGRAARAGVGGSVVRAIEEALSIEIVDE